MILVIICLPAFPSKTNTNFGFIRMSQISGSCYLWLMLFVAHAICGSCYLWTWYFHDNWPPDNIPEVVLKMCFPELPPVLSKLFNKCLLQPCFPSCWKFSSVILAYKNDDERSDPRNYRPLRLLSIISKVLETLINNKLINHLENSGLFSDLQYAFRASPSTADVLTAITEITEISITLEKPEQLH